MIDYLLSYLVACSGGAASLDYDTVAKLCAVGLFLMNRDSQRISINVIPPFCLQLEKKIRVSFCWSFVAMLRP